MSQFVRRHIIKRLVIIILAARYLSLLHLYIHY